MKDLTTRQRIGVVNAAMQAVSTMHGAVTDKDHTAECKACGCEYGQALRGLRFMRRELYAALQRAKKTADDAAHPDAKRRKDLAYAEHRR